MGKFVGIFFLAVLANLTILSSAFEPPSECNTAPSMSPLSRLKEHVLCNIDYERPAPGGNATNVNIALMPTLLHFDEDTSNLELHSLLYVEWVDMRLTWNASLFDDIAEILVPSYRMWIPEFTNRGPGSSDPNSDFRNAVQCYISTRQSIRGQVGCMFSTVFNIRCETDFTRWPFDRHNCTVVLAAWDHTDEQIKLIENSYDLIMSVEYAANQEWTLSVGRVFHDSKNSIYFENATTMALTIDFVLDRTAGCLRGQFISPAIIMMVMTVVTTFLEPQSIERFAIACSNIMVHLLCIQNLSWSLPHNGTTVPNILLFYCDSLVLAVIALLLTFVLGKIETTKTFPPKWITSSVVRILKNKYGQAFLLSIFEIGDPRPAAEVEAEADDTSALVNSDSNSKKLIWRYVTILFLRISFFVYIFTYFIMYIVLIHLSSIKPVTSHGTD